MHKRISLLLILIMVLGLSTYSQEYAHVDKIVETYPRMIIEAEELTDLINRDFVLDAEKARAIYMWISANIVYDMEAPSFLKENYSYSSQRNKKKTEDKIRKKWANKCLKIGKAECEGYATLYKYFCDLVDVECIIIPGNTKRSEDDIGNPNLATMHAWNAVRIESEWLFVDPTWGSGIPDYSSNTFYRYFDNTYFLTLPEKFFYNHFPEDIQYLFTDRTKEEYIDLPVYYSEFLKMDLEIIEPQTGIIKFLEDDKIFFKMKSPTGLERLTYIYDEEDIVYAIEISKENEFYVFEVKLPKERKRTLTIYCKGRGFVTFKFD